jgi:hypothetical protein
MTNSSSAVPPFPFPFARAVGETAASAALLDEMPVSATAALEDVLEEVHRWMTSSGEAPLAGDPPGLNGVPGELVAPLQRTFELMRETADEETRPAIGLGMLIVADWAERERAPRTAVVFYQAALLALPERVGLVYQIGRLLRSLSMWPEAEEWLLSAASRAEEMEDWENHGLALSGLGNLKRECGDYFEAVRYQRQAVESANAHGARRIEGDALYDLAVMCFQRADRVQGMAYARKAIHAYGSGHDQLLRLSNDIAWIFMHLYGEARFALSVFQSIEPQVHEPAVRAVLLANIARAAAEMSAEHIYELAALEAYSHMRAQRADEGHAAALAQLALAAIAAGQAERGRQMAGLCLVVASRRGEGHFIIEAERILDVLGNDPTVPDSAEEVFPKLSQNFLNLLEEEEEEAEDFASELMAAVKLRRDHAPISPIGVLIRGT